MEDGWGGSNFKENIFKQPTMLKWWAVLFEGNYKFWILDAGF
jgi:hypothetical protein